MTAKRDLKRRIRARQARTQERYTTAREHVLAERPGAVPVVDLVDLSPEAARVGLKCRVVAFPDLADRLAPEPTVRRIRDVLAATADDPGMRLFRAVALDGERLSPPGTSGGSSLLADGERFVTRALAGLGGVSESGVLLAVPVVGRQGLETVV